MPRSATVPLEGQTDADVLHARHQAWADRPLLRSVYARYFEWIASQLAPGRQTVELGGGAGHLASAMPGVVVSDIVATPYVRLVADAMCLPFADAALDNLVMIDVLHHLPRPARFFDEATRVLRPGGRVIMVEPGITPVSRVAFRLGHPEPVDLSVDPLPKPDAPVFSGSGPFASNQAIPTLLFSRRRRQFAERFPLLRLRTCRFDSVLAYPLSGGFSGPRLLPDWLEPLAWAGEWLLSPLRRLLGFRLLVTLERGAPR